ncbi:hypothetical protein A0H81_14529 [Grifola frondosa]|uniref:Uncharacterized protein n=1 Tax=Grifola frondosa TaxID=5627 RepID=A0A1C7LLE5_GRIFR|nr:hypothetical protein A0H81_14529 [Grifola frondosa]
MPSEYLLPPSALFSTRTTFATSSRSTTSDILLVSKRWLRVATPQLYECIILRTNSQASTLSSVLKSTPHFGEWVRRLRIEAGYQDVFSLLSSGIIVNVETLYFLVDAIEVDVDESGIHLALSNISPSHVLIDSPSRWWFDDGPLSFVQPLLGSIAKWTSLSRVDTSDLFSYIWFASLYSLVNAYFGGRPCPIQQFAAEALVAMDLWNKATEPIQRVLRFGSLENPTMPGDDVMSVHHPELPDDIWSHVFVFAMHSEAEVSSLQSDGDSRLTSRKDIITSTLLSILSVCKCFHRLARAFIQNVDFTRHVATTIQQSDLGDKFTSLVTLSLSLPHKRLEVNISPSVFYSLGCLRSFQVRGGCTEWSDSDVLHYALPGLRRLDIVGCGRTLVALFAEMILPSLTYAASSENLVYEDSRHVPQCDGAHHIESYCSPLSPFRVTGEDLFDIKAYLASKCKHTELLHHKCGLDTILRWCLARDQEYLSALTDVCITKDFVWPWNEQESSRTPWQGFARKLAKNNIALLDGNGIMWRRI